MNFGNQNQAMHLYQNPGYNFERRKRQTLIVDVNDTENLHSLTSATDFSLDLFEPLLIDKESEIYLDNFISFGSNISNIPNDSAFCLNINEFNIQSNVASADKDDNGNKTTVLFNKLVIPNEHNSTTELFSAIVHKGKKYNYVCDINPCKLGRISGKITNLAGSPIFAGNNTSHTHIYLLSGFSVSQISNDITIGEKITFQSGFGTSSNGNITSISPLEVNALVHSAPSAPSIVFASDTANLVLNKIVTLSLRLTSSSVTPINLNPGDTISQLAIGGHTAATGTIQESKTISSHTSHINVQVNVTTGAFTGGATATNTNHATPPVTTPGITINSATNPTMTAYVTNGPQVINVTNLIPAQLSLIEGDRPRFISEFTIISKE